MQPQVSGPRYGRYTRVSGGSALDKDEAPLVRAKRYREMAASARKHGKDAPDANVKQAYALMAEHWEKLAADAEAEAARTPDR